MKLQSLVLVMGGLLVLGGCGGGSGKSYSTAPASEPPVYSKPSMPESVTLNEEGAVAWQDFGVHDPSVIKTGDTYYIFGSHLAAAKSTDLLNWEPVSELSANEAVDESDLFDVYTTEIAEGIAWTDGYTGNWAADVIEAPNGKFWFYYNHCAQTEADGGCWNRSYLGLAEAESIEGPYVNKGVFLRSGYREAAEFEEFPLDNGQTTWDGAVDPNVIDPAAFFDKEGKLWMVYGSYSGGIFVLEMDAETGFPVEGQGYGIHLVGGQFRAIEGAYVLYSPESDYFYLFYSVAGFAAADGYNIRIARSRTPQGPYFDPAGNNIADIDGSIEIGGKLMGGFEFQQVLGEEGPSWGYLSPGHNSAYYDAATERHILVTHTRFPPGSTAYPNVVEAHAVRTHEMFVNNQGWLVASPQRYVPLQGDNVVDLAEVPGFYKFVNHGSGVNRTAIPSDFIVLHENRRVSGAENGSWYPQGNDSIRLVLDSGSYNGVVKWQWDNGMKALVPTFSAMSTDGETVWGTRTAPISATAEILAEVYDELNIQTELTINDEGYSLPAVAKNGARIIWESSNEYFIEADGSIFIPTPDLGDQTVNLSARIELNGQSTSKDFTVTLQARPAFRNAVAHYTFDGGLEDALSNHNDAGVTDNNLENVGAGSAAYTTGYAGQAFHFDGNRGVRLPDDIITSSAYTVSFWVRPEALTDHTPAFFAAANPDQWISFIPEKAWFTEGALIWSYIFEEGAPAEDEWNQIVHTQSAPLNDWQHVAITYGNNTMRLYLDGSLIGSMPRQDIFTEGGFFALGVNYGWDLPFVGQIDEFIVYDYALSGLDINGAAINNLTDPAQFAGFVKDALDLGDLTAIRENFPLPRVGPFVSGISWASSNETFLKPVNGTAQVTQPSALQGDQVVTLTATITYEAHVETKDFEVIVKSLAPAEYSFEGNLDEIKDAYASAVASGDRIWNTGGTESYVDGVVGMAVYLDGTHGIRLPDNLITTNSYSISLWLKPEVFTDYATAFFAGPNPSNWISLVPSMVGSNRTRLWGDMGGYFDNAELGYRIPLGQWTHIVMTVDGDDGDTIRIYVNGELELEANGAPRVFTVPGETNEFALGVNYWDTPYQGAVDELKIFSGAISSETVVALFEEGEVTVE